LGKAKETKETPTAQVMYLQPLSSRVIRSTNLKGVIEYL
jgi:hypothetical protein